MNLIYHSFHSNTAGSKMHDPNIPAAGIFEQFLCSGRVVSNNGQDEGFDEETNPGGNIRVRG